MGPGGSDFLHVYKPVRAVKWLILLLDLACSNTDRTGRMKREEDLLCHPLKWWAMRRTRTLTRTCHPAAGSLETPALARKGDVSATPCTPRRTETRFVSRPPVSSAP